MFNLKKNFNEYGFNLSLLFVSVLIANTVGCNSYAFNASSLQDNKFLSDDGFWVEDSDFDALVLKKDSVLSGDEQSKDWTMIEKEEDLQGFKAPSLVANERFFNFISAAINISYIDHKYRNLMKRGLTEAMEMKRQGYQEKMRSFNASYFTEGNYWSTYQVNDVAQGSSTIPYRVLFFYDIKEHAIGIVFRGTAGGIAENEWRSNCLASRVELSKENYPNFSWKDAGKNFPRTYAHFGFVSDLHIYWPSILKNLKMFLDLTFLGLDLPLEHRMNWLKDLKWAVAGHSRGGAFAQLTSLFIRNGIEDMLDVALDQDSFFLIGIASPRPFYNMNVDTMRQHFKASNVLYVSGKSDVVSLLPPKSLGYLSLHEHSSSKALLQHESHKVEPQAGSFPPSSQKKGLLQFSNLPSMFAKIGQKISNAVTMLEVRHFIDKQDRSNTLNLKALKKSFEQTFVVPF